jgi:hypothetical protein
MILTEKDQARFWVKVAPANEQGCMLWTAGKDRDGYGQFKLTGMSDRAHRISYTLANGPIPTGLQIDHLCRVRHCVAPAHLEAVSLQENLRRGAGGAIGGRANGAQERAKTHCPKGHAYAGENLYTYPDGRRECRACRREAHRRYHQGKADAR